MRRINWLLVIGLVCMLSACEWQNKAERSAAHEPACDGEPIATQYRAIVLERLNRVAAACIKEDYADLVDGARIATGFGQSAVVLENAHRDDGEGSAPAGNTVSCRAQLNITLSQDVFDIAQIYAPFIYAPNRYSAELNNVANINLVSRQGNVFTQAVSYIVNADDAGANPALTANDTEIARMAQTLTAALLPYGVKNTVTVDGVPTPREDALRQMIYPAPEDKNSSGTDTEASSVSEPVIGSVVPAPPEPNDLKSAQEHFAAAQGQLNNLWFKLDDTVRQSLAEEEGQWEATLNTRCARAASEYTRLECRTRLIEERVRYLQVFSID